MIHRELINIYVELTETPNSGEVELQMAPILVVANIASTANGQLGI